MVKNESLEKRFVRRLKDVMKSRSLTAERLAYESEISKGYMSMLLNHKVSPTLKMIEKIADNLEIDPKELL